MRCSVCQTEMEESIDNEDIKYTCLNCGQEVVQPTYDYGMRIVTEEELYNEER